MPQGTILAVRPIGLSNEYEWIEGLIEFIKQNYRLEVEIGVIETCVVDKEDADVNNRDKLLFIIPKAGLPDGLQIGSCDNANATKVKFKLENKPFRYAYDVKKL